jgi:DNA-binding MarR family transcriptional regulator
MANDQSSISIVVRLLAAQNLMLGALRRGLGPDLSLARFDLLAQLSRDDGQTLAELSRRMLVTAGNLTGLVDRAERDAIVERRPDPSDRRLTRVWLTPRGQKLAQKAIARHAELAEEILAPLEPREREELRRLLGRLREVLDDERQSDKGRNQSGRRAAVDKEIVRR